MAFDWSLFPHAYILTHSQCNACIRCCIWFAAGQCRRYLPTHPAKRTCPMTSPTSLPTSAGRFNGGLRRLGLSLFACLFAPCAFAAPQQAAPSPASLNDGPYIFNEQGKLQAAWLCDGEVISETVVRQQTLPPRCAYPHPINIPAFATSDAMPYRGQRITAISDIHGQFGLMVRLLQANGVIDEQGRWKAGDAHLVITGDVFDRGPQVTEAVWLLLQLQGQARQVGGEVHYLLGNHETMVLSGDVRYVNPKYVDVAKRLKRSVNGLYAKDTVIGEWLYLRPVMLKLGDTVFLHGGISPENLEIALDMDGTNADYRASLGKPKEEVRADPVTARLYDGKRSPIWYRGYLDGQLKPEEVRDLTDRLGIARIVVGHTTQKQVGSFHGGRVIAIENDIKAGESGELLFIEDGKLSRGLLDGNRAPLVEHPGAPEPD